MEIQDEAAPAPRAETPAPPAEAPRTAVPVGDGALAKVRTQTPQRTTEAAPETRRSQKSQTRSVFVYSEAELVDLLIGYEHLLVQEREATVDRISHEPALSCARRCVREGKKLPTTLPMDHRLEMPPRFRDHRGEAEYVYYDGLDMAEEDEDLLYGADRDLTDEELARIYGI